MFLLVFSSSNNCDLREIFRSFDYNLFINLIDEFVAQELVFTFNGPNERIIISKRRPFPSSLRSA